MIVLPILYKYLIYIMENIYDKYIRLIIVLLLIYDILLSYVLGTYKYILNMLDIYIK